MSAAETVVEDQFINGVNITKFEETVDAIKENPGLADFRFRSSNTWHDCGRSTIRISDFDAAKETIPHNPPFEIAVDEPEILLGKDEGANPVEILLGALSGCMTNTMVYYSSANGHMIDSVESEYEGDIDLQGFLSLDDSVNKGYNDINVTFRVKGDASVEELASYVHNSPVFDTLKRPIRIHVNVEKS